LPKAPKARLKRAENGRARLAHAGTGRIGLKSNSEPTGLLEPLARKY
jgi:hypothetical protein